MPAPTNPPAAKRALPDALEQPEIMLRIGKIAPDVLRATMRHYRDTQQDELRRDDVQSLRRLLAQAVAYAGPVQAVEDPFGEIEGL